MRHQPLVAITTTLLLACMGAVANAQVDAGLREARDLAMSGRKLTAEEVQSLEKRIDQAPNDVTSRTKLLGYYFGKQYKDRSAREAMQKHVFWLIQNAPESGILGTPEGTLHPSMDPDAYNQGKRAWTDHLKREPANLTLLGHSATFFLLHDRELAKESLQTAQALDRDNPRWPDRLGHLYSLDMMSNSLKDRNEAAGKALEQYEIAYKLSTETGRDPLLQNLAKVALAASDLDKAKDYAEKMLSQNGSGWNSGNNIHFGHIVLGKIAFQSDKLTEAKEHLIKAGQTPGSPQLNSFGPDMSLARDLLQKREKDVVLEYFTLCSKFWKMGRDRLDQWSAAVKEGNTPDFGSNLNR